MPRSLLRKGVANRIKRIRLLKGMTQEKAAEMAGFHYKYYQKIESGVVNLTLDSIDRISSVLKVSPKELFR